MTCLDNMNDVSFIHNYGVIAVTVSVPVGNDYVTVQ